MRRISECLSRSDTAVEAPVTTNSEPEARSCHHRACQPGPCRSLSPEELLITDQHLALAGALIEGGWRSVSTKYRLVRRWSRELPTDFRELIAPEWRDHPATDDFARHLEYWTRAGLRTSQVGVEERKLSINEFRAFKQLGGRMA
jgi:hypothetical protein